MNEECASSAYQTLVAESIHPFDVDMYHTNLASCTLVDHIPCHTYPHLSISFPAFDEKL
jgi:hypothetical protein